MNSLTLKELVLTLGPDSKAYKEYFDLIERLKILDCLEAAGVDNWEGYDYAQEMYENETCFPLS